MHLQFIARDGLETSKWHPNFPSNCLCTCISHYPYPALYQAVHRMDNLLTCHDCTWTKESTKCSSTLEHWLPQSVQGTCSISISSSNCWLNCHVSLSLMVIPSSSLTHLINCVLLWNIWCNWTLLLLTSCTQLATLDNVWAGSSLSVVMLLHSLLSLNVLKLPHNSAGNCDLLLEEIIHWHGKT
jgi:hypothetical protein